MIIVLNFVSLQSRVSILKACLRKSPISKVCNNAYIEPTPKACVIVKCFLKAFVLLCTLKPVYVSDESHLKGEEACQCFLTTKNVFPFRCVQFALFLFVLAALMDISSNYPTSTCLLCYCTFFLTGCWLRLCCQGYSWFQWCRLNRNLSAGKMITFVHFRAYLRERICSKFHCEVHLLQVTLDFSV